MQKRVKILQKEDTFPSKRKGKAHKKGLLTNVKAKEGVVVIKDTTKAALDDFVGFHYEKNIEFKKRTLKELFEILNLAEEYQTKELHDKVNGLIKDFLSTSKIWLRLLPPLKCFPSLTTCPKIFMQGVLLSLKRIVPMCSHS